MSFEDRPESAGGDGAAEGGERDERVLNSVGCLLALSGVLVAAAYAVPRAEYSYDGGFEDQDTDWSTVLVELPLILLAGFAVPPLTWAAATRRLRPWAAALVCLAVVALGLWGLDAVWHPKQGPDPGYGPGI